MNQFEILMLLACIIIIYIVIIIHVLIRKWIINIAIKQYIKPHLVKNRYEFSDKKKIGFFSSGAFKKQVSGFFIENWFSHYT